MDFEGILQRIGDAEFDGRDEIMDDMRDVWDNATNGAQATIDKTRSELEAARKQVTELQAQNYQLMMAATSKTESPAEVHPSTEPTDDEKNVRGLIDFGR